MIDEIIQISFHGLGYEDNVSPDHCYGIAYEGKDFLEAIKTADNLGYQPERFQQTNNAGSNGHMRLKNPEIEGLARIVSQEKEIVNCEKPQIIYTLYIPLQCNHIQAKAKKPSLILQIIKGAA